MITNINQLVSPVRDSLSDLYTNGVAVCGHLAGRAVNYLKHLPNHMQQNQNVAIAVFVVSNTIFFSLTNLFANFLNNRIDRYAEELTPDQEFAKKVVVNGLFVGGAVSCFNYHLSKATQYAFADQRINVALLAATTIAAIVARSFLNPKAAGVKNEENLEVATPDADNKSEDSTLVSPPKNSPSKKDAGAQADIEKNKALIAKLQEKIEGLEVKIATQQQTIDGSQHFKSTLTKALKDETALKEALATAQAELEKLQKTALDTEKAAIAKNAATDEAIKGLEAEKTALQELLTKKQAEVSALQVSLEENQIEIADLKKVSLQYSEDATTAQEGLAEANMQIEELKTLLGQLQTKYEETVLALKACQEDLASTQDKLTVATEEAELAKADLAKKEHELTGVNQTLQNTLANLKRTKAISDDKTTEINRLKIRFGLLPKTPNPKTPNPKTPKKLPEVDVEDSSSGSHDSNSKAESLDHNETFLSHPADQSQIFSPLGTRGSKGVTRPKKQDKDFVRIDNRRGSKTNPAQIPLTDTKQTQVKGAVKNKGNK